MLRLAFSLGLALVLTGCGGGGPEGPPLYPVQGEVTFDGQPIEEGRITFRKTEGDQKSYSTEIKNGQYSLESEAGKMTVEILASRLIPGKFDTSNPDSQEPVGEMYIPAKYNSQTTLTAEIKPEGQNQIPFALTSK